ncbi:hypothetical protein EA138_14585, partial [Anoxybacillus flavithermus]
PSPEQPCRQCGSANHWILDCPAYICRTCGLNQPGHRKNECRQHFVWRTPTTPSLSGNGDIYNEQDAEAL